MLQHSALEVISCFGLTRNVRLGEGMANDSQKPRQAFKVTLNTTHPGICTGLVLPEKYQMIPRVIMLTSPCNLDPLPSHFYIVKLGLKVVYIFLNFALEQRL